ncbi:MAG TPA: ABC transporter permease [Trueperaceae bacterium]|nr:ABC transporter permease [Trueperaceae bacterium]
MHHFVLKRLLRGVLTVWFVVSAVFLASRLAGDPVDFLLPDNATVEQRAEQRRRLGLDEPLAKQYVRYLASVVRGDFGDSFRERRPVVQAFGEKLPATLKLAGASFLLAVVLGGTAGTVAALNRNGPLDRFIMSMTFVGQALPNFVLGITLILVFSLFLQWLPSGGQGDWRSFIMPVITLGTSSASSIARLMRSGMLDVLGQDYVRTARAKGVLQSVIVVKHALRNACLAALTVLGMQAGVMIAGSVIVETVFAWPGIGRLVVTAVTFGDFPVLQFAIVMVSASVVLANSITDALYTVLDPRVRVA